MSRILNTGKIRGNQKSRITSIALIALLALSIVVVLAPNTSAHTPAIYLPQWAYINAFPSPVGVGQTISVFAWTANYPTTANGAYGDRWTNVTIIETKPDGSNVTLGPFIADPVGTVFASVVATEPGNYSFQAFFPAHLMANSPNGIQPSQLVQAQAYAAANNVSLDVAIPRYSSGGAYLGDTSAAAMSTQITVNVQSEAIPDVPSYPLPTQYWSTPVAQPGHQNWAFIMGDWLSQGIVGSIINDYTTPPTTAHVAWTRPITFGGVGGQPLAIDSGGDNYYSMLSYETMYSPGIIMNGMLYYNTATPPEYGFVCVDLHTGQQVWYQNGTSAWAGTNSPSPLQIGSFNKNSFPQLSFGQELDFESPNQHGLVSTLFSVWTASNGSSVWSLFDAYTGNWICNLWNVPGYSVSFGSPSLTQDDFGDFIIYSPNFATKTLSVWNSTAAIINTYEVSTANPAPQYGNASNSYWFYRPALGAQIDSRIGGNSTFAITGTLPSNAASATLFAVDKADQELIYTTLPSTLGIGAYPTAAQYIQFAISTNPATIGNVVWSTIADRPASNVTCTFSQNYIGNGVFAIFQKETRLWMGFSTTTGTQLWTTATPEIDNHVYGVTGGIYNGVLYSGDSSGTGGHIYAYNATTGTLLFDSISPSAGYGAYWTNVPTGIGAMSAGQIFWYGPEHSPGPNLEPGEYIGTIDSTTGAQIWNISFWDGGGAKFSIADGYMVALNNYDNQLYAFGKGQTTTTVQTPLSGVTMGQGFTVQGTVMDISAGTKQTDIAARFPTGVAAVSDNDQTAWMEYVYMQNPAPTSATGVDVTVTLIDPNGNANVVGTAHSNSNGFYNFKITTSMTTAGAGTYTVITSFDGSHAYWPSQSQSSFTLNEAAVTPAPTATPQSAADMYFVPAIAGLFVLIIIVAIVLALLMLRKHP